MCAKKLKDIPQGFDAFSFLNPVTMRYCENNKCNDFGNVTVVGIAEREEQPKSDITQ